VQAQHPALGVHQPARGFAQRAPPPPRLLPCALSSSLTRPALHCAAVTTPVHRSAPVTPSKAANQAAPARPQSAGSTPRAAAAAAAQRPDPIAELSDDGASEGSGAGVPPSAVQPAAGERGEAAAQGPPAAAQGDKPKLTRGERRAIQVGSGGAGAAAAARGPPRSRCHAAAGPLPGSCQAHRHGAASGPGGPPTPPPNLSVRAARATDAAGR
jgi:hypothetical protein